MISWVPPDESTLGCYFRGPGAYIRAEFLLHTHSLQTAIVINEAWASMRVWIPTVRLFGNLLAPVHACVFSVWGKQGLVRLS